MTTARTKVSRLTFIGAAIGVTALVLTACSGGAGAGKTVDPKDFTLPVLRGEHEHPGHPDRAQHGRVLDARTRRSRSRSTTQPQASYDQQLQLLAGQDALPSIFASGNSPQVAKDLESAGQLVDIGAELDEARRRGRRSSPPRRSTIEALYDGKVLRPADRVQRRGHLVQQAALRRQRHRACRPRGTSSRIAAADKLNAAGVMPFSADGQDGWPLTRLVGNYLFRTVGPDALSEGRRRRARS